MRIRVWLSGIMYSIKPRAPNRKQTPSHERHQKKAPNHNSPEKCPLGTPNSSKQTHHQQKPPFSNHGFSLGSTSCLVQPLCDGSIPFLGQKISQFLFITYVTVWRWASFLPCVPRHPRFLRLDSQSWYTMSKPRAS